MNSGGIALSRSGVGKKGGVISLKAERLMSRGGVVSIDAANANTAKLDIDKIVIVVFINRLLTVFVFLDFIIFSGLIAVNYKAILLI
ncbi:hypothetical protein I3271_07255 [Photobacterium leiognathi]|uniref:hypothetical protein n=1 Tax=Photobacterium leiognathi TaxID=553611 RepID=UPI001EDE813B|nr:hypothetical protein [Photobacterium leiognathi]MCG3884483.1 hypothetical protein [Photobacterium leiognathi]